MHYFQKMKSDTLYLVIGAGVFGVMLYTVRELSGTRRVIRDEAMQTRDEARQAFAEAKERANRGLFSSRRKNP